MTTQSFDECVAFSTGHRERTDTETLQKHIAGCTSVRVATPDEQSCGIDYVVTLRGGREELVDAKTRRPGVSRYWKRISGVLRPELALEIYSDIDRKVAGWTLNEANRTDLILYTFPPSEWPDFYLLSFSLLRLAFRRYFKEWTGGKVPWRGRYTVGEETSERYGRSWRSLCVFVPVDVVFGALEEVQTGTCEVKR